MIKFFFITEINEESSVSFSLVVRHGHDTADVVLLRAVLLLGEVAHQMATLRVILRVENVSNIKIMVTVLVISTSRQDPPF
jgi:hypothetical protein